MENFKYKHILFDLDGTIFDTHKVDIGSMYEVLKEFRPDTKETINSLGRFFGIPGTESLKYLGFDEKESKLFMQKWLDEINNHCSQVTIFPGILAVLRFLKDSGLKLGIITSRKRSFTALKGDVGDFLPFSIQEFFKPEDVVCSDDVARPKPFGDSLIKYMQTHDVNADEILFIGDAKTDLQCANECGVDFAIALWGYCLQEHLICSYYLKSPYEILTAILTRQNPAQDMWYKIASELNAIGQNGLAYVKDVFDEERYTRIQEIAANIFATYTNTNLNTVQNSISFEKGYRTPKIDTRAAIFNDQGEILLVQEKSRLWSLPGGWCDEYETIVSNTIKEVKEEACLNVYAKKLIAIVDRNKYNRPVFPYGILKCFILCSQGAGEFTPNSETINRAFFAKDKLPKDQLRVDTTTYEQLMMCFEANENSNFIPVIE